MFFRKLTAEGFAAEPALSCAAFQQHEAPEQPADRVRCTPTEQRLHNPDCPCKRTKCSRYGNCATCREHHKDPKQNPPACERTPGRERRKRER